MYGAELVCCVPVATSRTLSLVLEKYLRTSLASALAACRRVCCALPISTAACIHKMNADKKINDGTEAPQKNKTFFSLQEKLNIINKHDTFIHGINVQ